MFLRNVRRIRWKRESSLGAVLVLAVLAAAAVAATSWTVIIGTSGNDTINEAGKSGNYRLWGLAGRDVLTGGTGNNVLVGDGSCPPGARTDTYCQINTIPGDGGDTIRGGSGSNWIYGGGGPNTLYGGTGPNYIQAGPSTNVIHGGSGGDAINATVGTSTIYTGTGTNVVNTQNGRVDHVYCSSGKDTVYADRIDVLSHCAKVIYTRPAIATRWDLLAPGARPKSRVHGRHRHVTHRRSHRRGHGHGRH
jgi:Ca2+-binding RTX toxin-like protein